jgi:hypothetical protein
VLWVDSRIHSIAQPSPSGLAGKIRSEPTRGQALAQR